MRIVAVSDTHNQHSKLNVPDGDVFIHAGDATDYGRRLELVSFFDWMNSLPHKNKIYVPGNHDKQITSNVNKWSELYPSISILIHNLLVVDDKRFYGCMSMWGYGEPVEKSQSCDVLITHNAPYGILDNVESGENIGCLKIHKTVERLKPAYHLFGHNHNCGGRKHYSSGTTFCNLASCDESKLPLLVRDCLIIDLP